MRGCCGLQEMDAATQQMDNLGGWEFREQAEAMLAQVGTDLFTPFRMQTYTVWSTEGLS